MITGLQIRGGREMLRWSAADLAKAAGLSLPTIQRLERFDGLPAANMKTINSIYQVLQKNGIEFIGTPEDGPGVRLRAKPKS